MTGPGMILAGQLSALVAAGLAAVTVAVWPAAHTALAALLRAAARLARTALDRMAAARTMRQPARHRLAHIPAQRRGGA